MEVSERYSIELLEIAAINEIDFLANQYIDINIIPVNKKLDALHIAFSTVHKWTTLEVGIISIWLM